MFEVVVGPNPFGLFPLRPMLRKRRGCQHAPSKTEDYRGKRERVDAHRCRRAKALYAQVYRLLAGRGGMLRMNGTPGYLSTGRPRHSNYTVLSMNSKGLSPSLVWASARCTGTPLTTNSVQSA